MVYEMIDNLYDYGDVALKLGVGLCAFIVILRTTGRGALNQMTPLDLINNFVLGGIISGVIYNRKTTLLQFIIILLIWEVFIIVLNLLRRASPMINRFIVGGNVPIVVDGQYQLDAIKKMKLDLSDVATMMRIKDCALHEADFIRFESNGDLSVIKKDENKRAAVLINSGKIIDNALEEIGKSQTWLKEILKKKGLTLKDVFLAEWHEEKVGNKWQSDLFIVPLKKNEDVKVKKLPTKKKPV